MTAPGAVSDYDEETQVVLTTSMAATLNVPASDVSLTLTAESVNLVFTVQVSDSSDVATVAETAADSLGSAEAASAALGIAVLDDPVTTAVDKTVSPPPSTPPTPPMPPIPALPPPVPPPTTPPPPPPIPGGLGSPPGSAATAF